MVTGATNPEVTIAIIGDVHDQWEAADGEALHQLGVDLALFVGDFGNEAVDVVQRIAALTLPKAVILGNHDAWYSASEWGRRKCPYDRQHEDRVQQQLDSLGAAHVGYSYLDFPALGLSVVGGRPFSWGGSDWKNGEFYQARYGIGNFAESTQRMVAAAQAARYNTVIYLGHCGPLGLGDRPEAPCGKDWQPIGGDHGDPDLADAIAQTRQLGKTVSLVAFGHMHHALRHTQQHQRQSLAVDAAGTVYLNAARVPRIVKHTVGSQRNFSLVTLRDRQVSKAALVWIDQDGIITREPLLGDRHPQPRPATPA